MKLQKAIKKARKSPDAAVYRASWELNQRLMFLSGFMPAVKITFPTGPDYYTPADDIPRGPLTIEDVLADDWVVE